MKTAYTHAKILDGTLNEHQEMLVQEGTVIVEDDKFSYIGENADLAGCKIVDLEGKYLLPGLINMHVHIASSGGPDKKRKKPINYKKLFETLSKYSLVMSVFKKMQEKNVRDLLFSGVTTIRTVGGILDFDGQIRDQINHGKTVGPRMLVSNTAVSVPGGHFAGSLATEATSPEMAKEHVRTIAKTNPNWIKLMITGGVMDALKEGEPGLLRMNPSIAKAACDQAHALGYKVCAHVESTEGVRVALESGVDSIEHGAPLDSYLIDLFKKNHAISVCTLSPALPCAKCDSIGSEFSTVNSLVVLNGMAKCAKTCLSEGIPLGLGTDTGCPYDTAYNTWRELPLWVEMLDVSPSFALYAATLNNAKLLGIDQYTGSIEIGKSADFVVLDQNPLDNFSAFKRVYMVSVFGHTYLHPKLKKNKIVESVWDNLQHT